MNVHDGGVTLANSAQMSAARERTLQAEYAKALHDREHYWVAVFIYRITPPIQAHQPFDFENLRAGPAITCYICEQPYEPGVDPVCLGEVVPGVAPFWREQEE